MAQQVSAFERLATTDPVVAPLARLQAVALAAAEEAAWEAAVPDFDRRPADSAAPLLEDTTLSVDPVRQRALLTALASSLDQRRAPEAGLLTALVASAECEPLALLRASLIQNDEPFEALAQRAGLDPAPLTVVAHLASLPLLAACGHRAAELVAAAPWDQGYCPVCAAWPILAEVRGLNRDLFLRCGRCSSGWQSEHWLCPFCGSRDHRSQSYFAAEQERETRRAVTCDRCRGYLKTQTTLLPLDLAGLLVRDLESLALDMAAQEAGFHRPDEPGWGLTLRVAATRPGAADRQEAE